MIKVGKYTIEEIKTGTFGLDGGAMFGIVPKPLWQKTNLADEANRITLGARCLLLQSENRKVLVETGIGLGWNEKFREIYRIDQSENELTRSLKEKGIRPSDITDVILTHLHFDHAGGSVIFENHKPVPTFSNATYHVQRKHFEWADNPSDRDRGSFIHERFIPLAQEGVLNLLVNQLQFDDEIEFILVNGHTPAQQLLKISDSSNTYLYCADLLPFHSHIPLPYIMSYDIQPLETLKEKKEILDMAVKENWKLIFEHDDQVAMATVQKTQKGYAVKEIFEELK